MSRKKSAVELVQVKLRVDIKRYLKPESEDYGIYQCTPLEFNPEDIKVNRKGVLTIKGEIPQPLRIGRAYTVNLNPNFDYNAQYDGYTYNIGSFETEQLTIPEEQFEFLSTITTESIMEQLETIYKGQLIIDLILDDKIDLNQIKGLKEKSFVKLKEKAEEYRDLGTLNNMLKPLGVSISAIRKIAKHFGNPDRAHFILKKSMYNLCQVKGWGFTKVDEIALKYGVSPTSRERIMYCFAYLIEEGANEGHSWNYRDDIKVLALEKLAIEPHYVDAYLDSCEYVKGKEYRFEETIVINELVSTFGMYWDERNILNQLDRIDKNYEKRDFGDVDAIIDRTQLELGIQYVGEQRDAIKESLEAGVYVLEGAAGSGKCVKGDTLIPTEKGMIRIEDIPLHFDVKENNESVATIASYTLSGERLNKDTSHFFNMGHSETIKITTAMGYTVEGTPEHPIITINQDGEMEFKKLKDFDGTEVIPISKNTKLFSTEKDIINSDIAYILGLLVGDGTTNCANWEKPQYSLILTNSNKNIYQKFHEIILNNFGYSVKQRKDGNTFSHSVNSKHLVSIFSKEYGLPLSVAKDKFIPFSVMLGTKEIQVKFLQGLFDTDGCTDNKGFEYSTASSRLAHEVHNLLLNFGIVSKLTKKVVNSITYYRIVINATFLEIFSREIGYLNNIEKQEKLNILLETQTKRNPNIGSLKNLSEKVKDVRRYLQNKLHDSTKKNHYQVNCNGEMISLGRAFDKRITSSGHKTAVSSESLSKVLECHTDAPHYKYLKNITDNFFIDTIKSIEESECVVYDFTVPETHSFVANGIVNHNTTIIKAHMNIMESMGRATIGVCLSGKAANVLFSKGVNSSTIHRALGYNGGGFSFDEEEPMSYRTINHDEAGMTNANLWSALLSAIPDGGNIIITGDSGQLSAIGAGDVLRDLLASNRYKKRKLLEIHRQAAKSGVIQIAHQVRNGEFNVAYGEVSNNTYGELQDLQIMLMNKPKKDEVYLDPRMTDEQEKEALNPLYVEAKNFLHHKIQQIKFSDDPERGIMDFQVICPVKSGALGVESINSFMQMTYNSEEKIEYKRGTISFRKNDKILMNGNKYKIQGYASIGDFEAETPIMMEQEFSGFDDPSEMEYNTPEPLPKPFDVFNGSLGVVQKVYPEKKTVLAKFEGVEALVAFSGEDVDALDLGYAITVHKSQGSSLPFVLYLLDYSSFKLLSWQLIYTAITRTSYGGCIVIAEANALRHALQVDSSSHRRTFLGLLLSAIEAVEEEN